MSNGDWSGEPDVGARCLKLCREVLWNTNDPQAPYTLRGVVLRPRPRSGYPSLILDPLTVYVEYYGEAGEYDVWVELVRLTTDEDGEVLDEVEEASYGPYTLNLLPDRFVQGRSYLLRTFPLPEAGIYELRLRLAGVESPLIAERLFAEE